MINKPFFPRLAVESSGNRWDWALLPLVLALIALTALIWVPVGVWIGMNPHWAGRLQALAQFLAAFPANLMFPVAVLLIVRWHLNPNYWRSPLMQALSLLGFTRLADGDLHITPLGREYVEAANADQQTLFGRQLLAHVPLVAHIRHSLDQEPSEELPEELFLGLLRESLDAAEAERVMRTAIEWGRHGEIFEYNYHNGLVHLREPDEADAAPAKPA